MSYLVDTDTMIDAFRRSSRARNWLGARADEGLLISLISVGEMYEGAHHASNPTQHLFEIRRFLADYATIGLDDAIMQRFARERASLRRQGRMIADLDLLIAATPLAHDLTLVTRNVRHFERVPGLMLQSPDAP